MIYYILIEVPVTTLVEAQEIAKEASDDGRITSVKIFAELPCAS